MTTQRPVRRCEQRAWFPIAAAFASALVACGQPQQTVGASASHATSAAGANFATEPVLATAAMTEQPLGAAMPSFDVHAAVSSYASQPANRPSPADARSPGRVPNQREAPSSLELEGTGIDGTKAFAIVRMRDEGVVTVHDGDAIGRYTVRAIQPDRVRLASPDNEATLRIGDAAGDDPPTAVDASRLATSAERAVVAAGINTDQSIPEHVVYGPTARWTDGGKHVH
jgi:hypothetical protein